MNALIESYLADMDEFFADPPDEEITDHRAVRGE